MASTEEARTSHDRAAVDRMGNVVVGPTKVGLISPVLMSISFWLKIIFLCLIILVLAD